MEILWIFKLINLHPLNNICNFFFSIFCFNNERKSKWNGGNRGWSNISFVAIRQLTNIEILLSNSVHCRFFCFSLSDPTVRLRRRSTGDRIKIGEREWRRCRKARHVSSCFVTFFYPSNFLPSRLVRSLLLGVDGVSRPPHKCVLKLPAVSRGWRHP